MNSGVYCLVLRLKTSTKIKVGKLGIFDFPAGYYIYTGSAKNSLNARIARHLRKEKNKHWHIDYFVEKAKIVAIFKTDKFGECELNKRIFEIGNCQAIARGFGSSDCKCESHLAYIQEKSGMSKIVKFFKDNGIYEELSGESYI
ncbi:MAG: GIY-YIG nuclease family protein [Candidatus Hydrothermarchaeota archaeon]|nr:MAG: GIY-YIG nuclease family protein [Candidatus Hydrothermarchaeota archaeon]